MLHVLCMYTLVSYCCCSVFFFFFFKQKTAYEMRISDWSSDVCSSDLTSPYCSAIAYTSASSKETDVSVSLNPDSSHRQSEGMNTNDSSRVDTEESVVSSISPSI